MAENAPAERVRRLDTGDGSTTLLAVARGEIYHSRQGAVTESRHVFIGAGLDDWAGRVVDVLEVGFGTGLNAFLTAIWAAQTTAQVRYLGVEAEPLDAHELALLNFGDSVDEGRHADLWRAVAATAPAGTTRLAPGYELRRLAARIEDLELPSAAFDVLFHDAFAPAVQPELWTEQLFRRLAQTLRPGGRLVTYCAKGDVRRALLAAGLRVEKLPGPPGKREMLRAWRPSGGRQD